MAGREDDWRQGVEVVAMDGFSGFKTTTTEKLPDAVTVMDPFHVIRLAGDAWTSATGGSSSTSTGTAAARATRCTPRAGPCTPGRTCSPRSSRTG